MDKRGITNRRPRTMIDHNIPLVEGMIISDDVFTNRLSTIIKVGRKYATITPYPGLPGIDRPRKVPFYQIYDGCTEKVYTHVPPRKEWLRGERKNILIESVTGIQSVIDIAKDRDPENYVKHNAPNFRYIKTMEG